MIWDAHSCVCAARAFLLGVRGGAGPAVPTVAVLVPEDPGLGGSIDLGVERLDQAPQVRGLRALGKLGGLAGSVFRAAWAVPVSLWLPVWGALTRARVRGSGMDGAHGQGTFPNPHGAAGWHPELLG